MGQAIKYAVLGIALAGIIISVAAVMDDLQPSALISDISSGVSSAVSFLGSAFRNVRGCMNYIMGGSAVFNILIWVDLMFPLFYLPIAFTVVSVRFINQ